MERFLRLVARPGHERLMVIQGDHVEDKSRDGRVGGADQRFGTAGAFLEMEPDDDRVAVFLHCLDHLDMHQMLVLFVKSACCWFIRIYGTRSFREGCNEARV